LAPNKDRLDNMFYADLLRVCATYSPGSQSSCNSLASTYYEAVHVFGRTNVVTQADLDRAAELKQDSLDR
jgi:hypothetical protein